MSLFSNFTHWLHDSGVEDQIKQEGIKELKDSANQLLDKVKQHSPDMANHIEGKLFDILSTAVAGALTRK